MFIEHSVCHEPIFVLINVYIYIYIYIGNHENNVPSRLSPQWYCGNSCTWAHDVRLYHVPYIMYGYIMIRLYHEPYKCAL